jgi:DNA-binding transcriptional MerR regulator
MLISEIARISGLSKDGVRHYEAMGLIASSPRQAGSKVYRDYDPAVLKTIEQVRQAQNLGFSLKEIEPLLKAYGSATLTPAQTVDFLEQRLTVIREKQGELRQVEAFICTKLESYRQLRDSAPAGR